MSDNTFLDKVKAGHPIQTMDGRPAKFIGYAPELRCMKPLVVSVDGHLGAYDDNGRLYVCSENPLDLMLAPKIKLKRETWARIWPADKNGFRQISVGCPTEEECRMRWDGNGSTVVLIEWEEDAP